MAFRVCLFVGVFRQSMYGESILADVKMMKRLSDRCLQVKRMIRWGAVAVTASLRES
ncbi:unnamed protein product [Protopolystoma xenopodis]|uniref:Uncharacterized protein n=1 Tax=Protopolystoma xenopodis TaxID=117903 RepID=A0A448XJ67_9PLAT|nr:unnamed protein product [Protopolystoma xenopodis]